MLSTNINFNITQYNEEEFQLRTPAARDYHCSLLSGDMAESDSVTYGIRYRSPLNDIEHFHVANMMQMPQDVMHVLFEGVLAMEVHMMICALFKKKYLTLSVLNERLNAFDFGTAEARNQPPKSFKEKDFDSSSTKLHLSGTYIYNINVVSMTKCFHIILSQLPRCGHLLLSFH